MNETQKGRISKRKAFQILGWAMIAWAVVDVGISLASLLGSESFRQALDMQNGTLALVIMLALIAFNTAFYVMGGIAAIRLNYRLGMAALVILTIDAVLFIAGRIMDAYFDWNDLRYALVPAVYASAYYPAKKEEQTERP